MGRHCAGVVPGGGAGRRWAGGSLAVHTWPNLCCPHKLQRFFARPCERSCCPFSMRRNRLRTLAAVRLLRALAILAHLRPSMVKRRMISWSSSGFHVAMCSCRMVGGGGETTRWQTLSGEAEWSAFFLWTAFWWGVSFVLTLFNEAEMYLNRSRWSKIVFSF